MSAASNAPAVALERGLVRYGDPGNPPILFLHGIRLAGRIWEPHALLLCDEFEVLTPDLPGHGALAGLPFSRQLLEEYLLRLTATLSRPPLVVGYSLGGYAAMLFALAHPDRTAGLLLTGCSADITGLRRAGYELAVRCTGMLPPPLLSRALAVFFRLTLPRRLAETITPFRFDRQVFAASCKMVAGVRFSDLIGRYGKPVCIVNGQWDLVFRGRESAFAQAAAARVVVLRGATHVAPLSRIREFSALVRAFAHTVQPGPGTTASGPRH